MLKQSWRELDWQERGECWIIGPRARGDWLGRAALQYARGANHGGGWHLLIDGTEARHAPYGRYGAQLMLWHDLSQAAWDAHEMLLAGFAGPSLRFRSALPWVRTLTPVPDGATVAGPYSAMSGLLARPMAHSSMIILPHNGWFVLADGRAGRVTGHYVTVGGIASFADELHAMHTADKELMCRVPS
jgi:hypothetical protein